MIKLMFQQRLRQNSTYFKPTQLPPLPRYPRDVFLSLRSGACIKEAKLERLRILIVSENESALAREANMIDSDEDTDDEETGDEDTDDEETDDEDADDEEYDADDEDFDDQDSDDEDSDGEDWTVGAYTLDHRDAGAPGTSLRSHPDAIKEGESGGHQRASTVPPSNRNDQDKSLGDVGAIGAEIWGRPSKENNGIDEKGVPTATGSVPESTKVSSSYPINKSPEENGKTEVVTTLSYRRAKASIPQRPPVRSAATKSYRPGQIVWLPSHSEVSMKSILHGHEDFGLDSTGPDPFAYQQAYAHPALVFEEIEKDDSILICLKITAWSDWSDKPGGKWLGGGTRQRFYVPLCSTNVIQQGELEHHRMPTLTFEHGKSMPERERGVKNDSYLNVERVFLVEKVELRDFRMGHQKHVLVLTETSMRILKEYRNEIGRDESADRITLRRQQEGYIAWLNPPVVPEPASPVSVAARSNDVLWPNTYVSWFGGSRGKF